MKLLYAAVFALLLFSSCTKVQTTPPSNNTVIVGTWALTSLNGEIDSTSTLNGVTNSYSFKVSYSNSNSQLVQTVNSNPSISIPYKMTINFGPANGADSISEAFTQLNSANVPINYAFNYGSYWVFSSVGLNILGLEKTHIFGNNVNSTLGAGQEGTIQAQLSDPSFGITGTYNLTATKLVFYFHLSYTGNPDVISGNGAVTNPAVQIAVDYELVFNKS